MQLGELGELKPSVAGDGVSQFFLQCCSLLIVGKLQEVEAGGGCGKSVDWIFLPQSEKSSQHRPDCISIIFILSNLNTPAKCTQEMLGISLNINSSLSPY